MTTGSWIVRRGDAYLTGAVGLEGIGVKWTDMQENAAVFPTKAAARRAAHGPGITYERSIGHEAQMEVERHKREQPE